LELPLAIVQRTDVPCLKPTGDTVEVESVITDTPGSVTLFTAGSHLVGLTINAEVHDVVSANGTVVNDDIPCPERDRVPFLNLKSFLAIIFLLSGLGGGGSVVNVHIIHD